MRDKYQEYAALETNSKYSGLIYIPILDIVYGKVDTYLK